MKAGRLIAGLCLGAALFAPAAQAGIFDDDEARRAILELRQKLEQSNEQARARQAEALAALTEQVNQLKRGLLDLNNQLEQMRGDNAKLRGQNEELARAVADIQRKQKDIQSGVDDRMRKFEPQKVTVDGKEFTAEPDEKRQYDEAMELLRKSDFAGTANALSAFRKRWPASGYSDSVLFWLGNAQYGTRQYKDAIVSFRALVSGAPDSAKAPEALLAIANCQAELKDVKSARRTIDELLKTYPKSEAAQAGKERLASLK
ncbi:MAG: tol-pal system protein YbgF [Burkholderiales bacterium]